jgi:sugar lactone lactonase YvrE
MSISKRKIAKPSAAIAIAVTLSLSGCNGCTPLVQQVWIADTDNNRVLDFSALNLPSNGANQVVGQPDFVSHGSNFSSSKVSAKGLNFPQAMAFDKAGNMWVADTGNNRVLEFAKDPKSVFNGVVTSANVVIGQPDFKSSSNDFGLASTNAKGLNGPLAVAFDGSGNLWVLDGDCRVVEFQPPFPASGAAASLAIGQSNLNSGCLGSEVMFPDPTGMAIDSHGDLFVADSISGVFEFKPPFSNGMAPSLTIGKNVCDNLDKFSICSPGPLAVDGAGNLWVADISRILEFAPPYTNGASLVLGQGDFTTTDFNWCPSPCTPGSVNPNSTGFSFVQGVAADNLGDVYVSDGLNNRVVEFIPPLSNGKPATVVFGQGSLTTNTAGASQSAISNPVGVTTPPQ